MIIIKKIRKNILTGLIIVLAMLTGYTYWDNNRVIVAEQDIEITDLPEELNGFTILQISDLHEHEFGKNQKRLVEQINTIDFDAIVFTGDMLNDADSTNYGPFYTLIEGIQNKENMLYVPGNDDPESYTLDPNFSKSAFVQGMETRGVKMLESINTIKRNEASIHFVDFELSIRDGIPGVNEGMPATLYATAQAFLDYQKQLLDELTVLDDLPDSEVVIALNHYPVVDARFDHIMDTSNLKLRDYDLLIAGHYHGGQIRLPFLGALFVPEAWYGNNGLFPPNDRVKGLWVYKGIKQYVSAGLGSSDEGFRLFNPPEINVLTLRKERGVRINDF
ncbi:metallophosphoesterase [Lentibacillus sp. N15]|uniref:metallophosphoesterase n=1 Tax=Lentibacillus songyuanensis TaxID=3136161 RepID=UPI0031BBAE1D